MGRYQATRARNESDIAIGDERWLAWVDFDVSAAEDAISVDADLEATLAFWAALETSCVAGCCGIQAFDFKPEAIRLAAGPAGGVIAESLRGAHDRVKSREAGHVLSDRLNQYLHRDVMLGLLEHILETLGHFVPERGRSQTAPCAVPKLYDEVRILAMPSGGSAFPGPVGDPEPRLGDVAFVVEIYTNPPGYELENASHHNGERWLHTFLAEEVVLEVVRSHPEWTVEAPRMPSGAGLRRVARVALAVAALLVGAWMLCGLVWVLYLYRVEMRP